MSSRGHWSDHEPDSILGVFQAELGIFYQSLKPNGKLNPVIAVRRMHRKSNVSNNFQKEAR